MMLARIISLIACAFAGAALGVSVAHGGPSGPRGPQGAPGPQGQTGRNAETAHLGVCVNITAGNMGFLQLSTSAWNLDQPVTAPVLTDGVPSCPSGQFVSIVPQASG
ncbi:MAG TPA: hypothetical protein VK586_01125 [Streptosporangiaceae bacterium]|nr:hypothetical protein [Streptosporangiaceae bacterium]